MAMKKHLIVYSFYDNDKFQYVKENLTFFIQNVNLNANNAELVIIHHVDDEKVTPTLEFDKTLAADSREIKVIRKKNKGYDFGAWGYALCDVYHSRLNEYDYFICLNTSVRGPFMPYWYKNVNNAPKWYECVSSHINDKVKLVGTSINYWKHPHIQSFFWATDRVGLDILVEKQILVQDLPNKPVWPDLVEQHEIEMSRVLMEKGYDIYAFPLSENMNHTKHFNKELVHGDISWPNTYYGSTLNPYETLFIKTKNIDNDTVKAYTKIQMKE